ncbi:MAG: MotA/TolQ/ExbB proton channel family protein [Saprospiraceae bacterium]|nr:MotA/TolQ/ExbB proton channel family protein [Saprospiraceae bacterium]
MKEKTFISLISACLTFCLLMSMMLLAQATTDGSVLNRIAILFGGNMPGGIIQGIIYFLFFYGWFEMRNISKNVENEAQHLNKAFLPEREQQVLLPQHVNDIKLKMIEMEQKDKTTLTDLIKKACTKFRSSNSVTEVMDLVKTQISIYTRRSESEQSFIRYILGAIPSVGFIGTVLGIAASLGSAGEAMTTDGLDSVTSMLYVAFDTTLVALVFGLVLMYAYHGLQRKVENLYINLESYVIENLVNRIYTPINQKDAQ